MSRQASWIVAFLVLLVLSLHVCRGLGSRQLLNISVPSEIISRRERYFSTDLERLLPKKTAVINGTQKQLYSHVVRITTISSCSGTGLLLRDEFVLTATSILCGVLYGRGIGVQLAVQYAVGQEIYVNPQGNLAIIRISPPILNTGRSPMPHSPKGFFWPIAETDPNLDVTLQLYGYNQLDVLSYGDYPVSGLLDQHIVTVRLGSAPSSEDEEEGGPVFSTDGGVLEGVQMSLRPGEALLVAAAAYREWIFESMRSPCVPGVDETKAWKLTVGNDSSDSLTCYYCQVEQAERFRISLVSEERCSTAWKAVVITTGEENPIAMLQTSDGAETSEVALTYQDFGWSRHFFIELWKTESYQTRVSIYGPYDLYQYMDGGLHLIWCARDPT